MTQFEIAGLILLAWVNGIYLGWLLWRKPNLKYENEKRID
jgi:hypothetical protein